jgi:hypothetical protein
MPRKLTPDVPLFGVVVTLVCVGVVMVYSASAIVAADRFHDPFFFLKKQLFWALLGLGGLWVGMLLDYRRLERLVIPLLVLSFALLVLVLVPPFGQSINGTRRWFHVGPSWPSSRSCSTWPRSSPGGRRSSAASPRACCRSCWWRVAWPRSRCCSRTWATASP